jgi:glucose/mannose transport system substrate-binding protein
MGAPGKSPGHCGAAMTGGAVRRILFGLLLTVLCLAGRSASAEATAEVLHWWTAGSEAAALKVIAGRFAAAGGRWLDNPVAGGGGDAARTVAKTRLLGGRPPTLMQWHLGLSLRQLAEEGLLGDVQAVAEAEHWDALLPPLIVANAKVGGRYVAIPVGIHGENWLWTNSKVLAAVGVAPPRSWEEFDAAAAKLKAAGYIPLALGGQAWQQVVVFDAVLLGVGGSDFYRKALVELDPQALAGATLTAVFEELGRIKGFIDPGSVNRDWNEATSLVINGKAAMQLMGDWAKGEFAAAGLQPGTDFGCALSPGAGTAYLVAADSFAVPRVKDAAQREGQLLMARTVMDPAVQQAFSLAKGSIPVRKDTAADAFDACSRQAMEIVRGGGELLPSVGSNMGIGAAQAGAVADAVALFFTRTMSAAQGAKALRDALEATR